jgi:5-methylcytosine-specific restriction endonuclease McrA
MAKKLKAIANRRRALLKEAPWCYYCKAPLQDDLHARDATVDHKQPLSRGGSDDDANTALACGHCNREKGDMTEAEFAAFRLRRRQGLSKKRSLMLAVLDCIRR